MRPLQKLFPVACTLVALFVPSVAHAVTITEIPTGLSPSSVREAVAGPDGAIWYTDGAANVILRTTLSGATTSIPMTGGLTGIAFGSDGALWVSRVSVNKMTKLSTSGVVLGDYPVPTASANPDNLALGTDGLMWFSEFNTSKIGRVSSTGFFTELDAPGQPTGIVAGPDNDMWVAGDFADVVREVPTSMASSANHVFPTSTRPVALTVGTDGGIWVASNNSNAIARVDILTGVVTRYPVIGVTGFVSAATDEDGFVWMIGYVDTSMVLMKFDASGNALGKYTIPGSAFATSLIAGPAGSRTLFYVDATTKSLGRVDLDPVPAPPAQPTPQAAPAPDRTAPPVGTFRLPPTSTLAAVVKGIVLSHVKLEAGSVVTDQLQITARQGKSYGLKPKGKAKVIVIGSGAATASAAGKAAPKVKLTRAAKAAFSKRKFHGTTLKVTCVTTVRDAAGNVRTKTGSIKLHL